MSVKQTIHERRAYRALKPVKISKELMQDLVESAQLAPSCFNNQPWRFVFVSSSEMLKEIHSTLAPGNKWVQSASLIIVVYSGKDLDCKIMGREYYLFDTGLATAFIILRATELGLVAHPIAGYDEAKVKAILDIPKEMTVITLVNVGKQSDTITELLSETQAETEKTRPSRRPIEEFTTFL